MLNGCRHHIDYRLVGSARRFNELARGRHRSVAALRQEPWRLARLDDRMTTPSQIPGLDSRRDRTHSPDIAQVQ